MSTVSVDVVVGAVPAHAARPTSGHHLHRASGVRHDDRPFAKERLEIRLLRSRPFGNERVLVVLSNPTPHFIAWDVRRLHERRRRAAGPTCGRRTHGGKLGKTSDGAARDGEGHATVKGKPSSVPGVRKTLFPLRLGG